MATPVAAAAIVYYAVQGLRLANGDSAPLQNFVPQLIRVGTVIWLSSNLGAFNQWVRDIFFTGLPNALGAVIANSTGATGNSLGATAAIFDNIWSQIWIIVGSVWAQVGFSAMGAVTAIAGVLAAIFGTLGLVVSGAGLCVRADGAGGDRLPRPGDHRLRDVRCHPPDLRARAGQDRRPDRAADRRADRSANRADGRPVVHRAGRHGGLQRDGQRQRARGRDRDPRRAGGVVRRRRLRDVQPARGRLFDRRRHRRSRDRRCSCCTTSCNHCAAEAAMASAGPRLLHPRRETSTSRWRRGRSPAVAAMSPRCRHPHPPSPFDGR